MSCVFYLDADGETSNIRVEISSRCFQDICHLDASLVGRKRSSPREARYWTVFDYGGDRVIKMTTQLTSDKIDTECDSYFRASEAGVGPRVDRWVVFTKPRVFRRRALESEKWIETKYHVFSVVLVERFDSHVPSSSTWNKRVLDDVQRFADSTGILLRDFASRNVMWKFDNDGAVYRAVAIDWGCTSRYKVPILYLPEFRDDE